MTNQDTKRALVANLLGRMVVAARKNDIHGVQQVITDAWNRKVLPTLAGEAVCRQCFDLLTTCPTKHSDEHIVLVLAELGRLPSTIWSEDGWGAAHAKRLLSAGIPESFQYGDGEQRRRAASVLLSSGTEVEPDVLARAVVEERKGEKARRVWAKALLERQQPSGVFECLGRAIAGTETSGDGRSERLHSILQAINSQLPVVDIEIDDGICDGLRLFIKNAFFGTCPDQYKVSAMAVEELFNTAIQLVRFKFRLGAEADFYLTLAQATRWLPTSGWKRLTGRKCLSTTIAWNPNRGIVAVARAGSSRR